MSYDYKKETKRFLKRLGCDVKRDDSIEKKIHTNLNLGTLEKILVIIFCPNNPIQFREALELRDKTIKEGLPFEYCPDLETLRENLNQIIGYLSEQIKKSYAPIVKNYLGYQLKEMSSLLKGLENID